MWNTQKFGQTKGPKESNSETKYKKWSVQSYKHAYRRAEVNRKDFVKRWPSTWNILRKYLIWKALLPEQNFVTMSTMWHIPLLPPQSNVRHTSCIMQCDIPTASDEWRRCTVPVCTTSTYEKLQYQHDAHFSHYKISLIPPSPPTHTHIQGTCNY